MTTKVKTNDVKKAQSGELAQEAKEEALTNERQEATIKLAEDKVSDLVKQLSEARTELRKLKGNKSMQPKGPGVISTILSLVTDAPKTGIGKQEILDKLVELFPEKAADGMSKTIQVQLPGRMAKERGINIKKTEDGKFYVEK